MNILIVDSLGSPQSATNSLIRGDDRFVWAYPKHLKANPYSVRGMNFDVVIFRGKSIWELDEEVREALQPCIASADRANVSR